MHYLVYWLYIYSHYSFHLKILFHLIIQNNRYYQ